MRGIVVLTACLAVATADIGLKLRQAAGSGASSYDVGQQSVNVDYAPTIYQDSVTDGVGSVAATRSSGAAGFPGSTARFGGAGTDYDAGYQAGLRAGATASVGAVGGPTGSSFGNSNARFGGVGALSGASAGSFGSSFGTGSSFGSSSSASASAVSQPQVRYAAPIVQKHFYYHVAPEEPKAAAGADTLTITPRKHYKIIFIKAPSVSANAGAKSQAASRTEEKTIVYVLVNKPAQAKAGAVADASSFSSGKPEVYFIKYQGKEAQAIANANTYASADTNVFSGSSADAYSSGATGFDGGVSSATGFSDGGVSAGLEANDFVDFGARSGVSSVSAGTSGYNAGFTAGYTAAATGAVQGVTPSYDGVAVSGSSSTIVY